MDRIYKKYPLDKDDGYILKTADTDHILKQLKALDLNENKRLKGLHESRADVFAYAVQIIKTIFEEVERELAQMQAAQSVEKTMKTLREKAKVGKNRKAKTKGSGSGQGNGSGMGRRRSCQKTGH